MLLIDPPDVPGHGRLWSHLASDESFEELHRFAEQLGIPARGFDRDHYDIPADRYEAVVEAGAVPVSSREMVTRLTAAGLRRRKRRAPAPRPPVRPPRLNPGDPVAVVAPSGPVERARLDAGLAVLRSWGLVVHETGAVRGADARLPYLAADDAARAEAFTRAWCDPGVRAVLCARGGYGVQRVVDLLDWQRLAEAAPKILVGFSDITALHQAFAVRLGLVTVHGPVVTSLGAGDDLSREHLRRLLFDAPRRLSLTPAPATCVVPGRAEGRLIGGNVALLAAGIGTRDAGSADGCIAVLEDVGEEPYRLDRLLTQLLRSGWFGGVRGIALGGFTSCGADDLAHRVLEDRLVPLGVPVVRDVAVGHDLRNLAFPVGVPAVLDADAGTVEVVSEPLA